MALGQRVWPRIVSGVLKKLEKRGYIWSKRVGQGVA